MDPRCLNCDRFMTSIVAEFCSGNCQDEYLRQQEVDEAQDEPQSRSQEIDSLREEVGRLREALEWLTRPHEVSTLTKQRSDYWANQFKLAMRLAKEALTEPNEEQG